MNSLSNRAERRERELHFPSLSSICKSLRVHSYSPKFFTDKRRNCAAESVERVTIGAVDD